MRLISFLVVIVGLIVVAGLAYVGTEKIVRDETLKKIGQYAFIGIAVIVLLYATGAVLFGAGTMMVIGPHQIIDFAIGLVVALFVLYILHLLADRFAPGQVKEPINYGLDCIALLAILWIAGQAFFGGGLGLVPENFGRLT